MDYIKWYDLTVELKFAAYQREIHDVAFSRSIQHVTMKPKHPTRRRLAETDQLQSLFPVIVNSTTFNITKRDWDIVKGFYHQKHLLPQGRDQVHPRSTRSLSPNSDTDYGDSVHNSQTRQRPHQRPAQVFMSGAVVSDKKANPEAEGANNDGDNEITERQRSYRSFTSDTSGDLFVAQSPSALAGLPSMTPTPPRDNYGISVELPIDLTLMSDLDEEPATRKRQRAATIEEKSPAKRIKSEPRSISEPSSGHDVTTTIDEGATGRNLATQHLTGAIDALNLTTDMLPNAGKQTTSQHSIVGDDREDDENV
jgi:hypothetical protein